MYLIFKSNKIIEYFYEIFFQAYAFRRNQSSRTLLKENQIVPSWNELMSVYFLSPWIQ